MISSYSSLREIARFLRFFIVNHGSNLNFEASCSYKMALCSLIPKNLTRTHAPIVSTAPRITPMGGTNLKMAGGRFFDPFNFSIFHILWKYEVSVGGLCSLPFPSILPRCLSVFFSLFSSCNHKNQQYVFIKQEWGSLFLCALILLTDTQGGLSDTWGWTVTGARRTRGTKETSSHKLRYPFPQNTVKA